jgi:hypothetical protein
MARRFRTYYLLAWIFASGLSGRASAEERLLPGASGDKHLVNVVFALDDKPETEMFHTVVVLWISEKNRGTLRSIYNWAQQDGQGVDAETQQKSLKCAKILKALQQPDKLPESVNQIVTVKCLDGDKTLVKKFPIDRVPFEVRDILTIMGFRDEEFSRLKFIKKPA